MGAKRLFPRERRGSLPRDRIALEAPAKVNLYLEVGPRRPDGYHPVRSVMQAIELCDLVEVELDRGGRGIEIEVEGDAPAGDDNLCIQAARAYSEWLKKPFGVRIGLKKRIPNAAGLGGGSSDAAAVLRGLQLLSGEDISREELFELAASLGSDVPFFLIGGTALAQGRGEQIFPLVQAPPLPILLANPGIELSTRLVYEKFDEIGGPKPPEGGPAGLIKSLASQDVERIPGLLFNSLQKAAIDLVPEIGQLLEMAKRSDEEAALLCGSGSTVFVMRENEQRVSAENQMKQTAAWLLDTQFRGGGVALLEPR
ncbi:MAG: 4-(cytidine 5'-diphospho)-2-C-methyl-D-erythritol kinase [Actinobacteria bacterium RBG_19FT_COMBO_54_7]|uniref:4-diphosphocytidyl-2-C-methyl-D-erythritol kinase n=1 Tax=Candidatus Solincola sediminis TaxID=1797199 RepID=A0A1F2WLJ0_9ACTN|nr:MAG: 4-(cytidine 5'-diphospho)-2-C-methyl-D-erythritol kinase [Candidatus Solincola sediminis]OFW65138.1 MAG: 4-(cytidine 5'-diphospho)-2-C-methyl-D-erythritol kinase [Actinobacteria bacterium RBG_19FT_COMBO_54_7]